MSQVQSAYSNSELAEQEYIRLHGQRMSRTIVETWLDGFLAFEDNIGLKSALRSALDAHLTDLGIAELASVLVGGPTFEQFLENQQ
jgi:hypothetical protein